MSATSIAGGVALAILLAIVVWAVTLYNRLVRGRNLVEEGWSGIDVQLKRRANLIPNLVKTVEGYADHERGLLEQVSELRGASLGARGAARQSAVERQLEGALGRLFAVAEAYPQLRADHNFRHLQEELSEIEDHIQMARRYYNGTVRDFNTTVGSFPNNLVAGSFGFTPAEYFELANGEERRVPRVSFS